jgi:hypothetical protein
VCPNLRLDPQTETDLRRSLAWQPVRLIPSVPFPDRPPASQGVCGHSSSSRDDSDSLILARTKMMMLDIVNCF